MRHVYVHMKVSFNGQLAIMHTLQPVDSRAGGGDIDVNTHMCVSVCIGLYMYTCACTDTNAYAYIIYVHAYLYLNTCKTYNYMYLCTRACREKQAREQQQETTRELDHLWSGPFSVFRPEIPQPPL